MLRSSFFSVFLLFFVSNLLNSQGILVPEPKYPELFKSIPTIDVDTPEWAKLMYSSEPNVNSIEQAYTEYYNTHPYKKTTHVQNYKHFMRYVFSEGYLKEDGTLEAPKIELKKKNKLAQKKSAAKVVNSSKLSANWTFIGPFETYDRGGITKRDRQVNIYTIEQSRSNPNMMIVGTETGAVFISTNKGEDWTVTADELGVGNGIGAVTIDPNDDKVLYFSQGNSLYKSIDQGGTWNEIHAVNGLRITAISINPNDSNAILTAGGKGIYRSINAGVTWTQIVADKCWDIQRKTNEASVVFVSKTNTVTNVTEVWKSIDDGVSFTAKTSGWFSPTGVQTVGNQGARIAVTAADPNRLYVLLLGSDENYATDVNFLGIYRSDDAGETWTLPYDGDNDGMADNDPGGPYSDTDWCLSCFGFGNSLTGGGNYDQGFYNASIGVSDDDPDLLLVGMLSMFRSNDGATTFDAWGGYICNGDCPENRQHPDIQEIEINGNDVWVASDGGLNLYDKDFNFLGVKVDGINATENWGFGQGWNEDVIVGGRYHNGNGAYRPSFTNGKFIGLGGGEAPTGYVSADSRVSMFSDISDVVVPQELTGEVKEATINLAMYPNQHQSDFRKRSEIVNDPRYTDVHYLGKDNKLWKTEDGGISYTLLKAFGTDVEQLVQSIEVPRDDPNYIYVSQRIPNEPNRGIMLWKSTDAGATWNEIIKPTGANHQYVIIQVAEDDKNEVYISFSNDWDNPNKVFKSLDGGVTWENLTTTTLDRSVRHLIIQNGTDGGVYAVTYNEVYYRNTNMTDWVAYGEGLPTRRTFNKLLPFYRDGKMRGATFNRGFVETPLYESFKPIAQPLANTEKRYCVKDTVYFDDYSVLHHTGASWEWNFPGASYVSSTTVRNPKVLYDAEGKYDVTLTVTDGSGASDTKTIPEMIKYEENLCGSQNLAGGAMEVVNTSRNFLSRQDIDIDNVSGFTMTAWIKPSVGIQKGFACIFMAQDSEEKVCSLNFRPDNNQLGFHWNGSQWWWDSGLVVPENEWSYVAIVVTPTNVTLYLNEEKAVRNYTSNTTDLKKAYIGSYNAWESRNYAGLIDEMAIWDKALTTDEIRLNRHLLKDVSDPNLKAYYQFNNILSGQVYDIINSKNMTVAGEVILPDSTAPVAEGVSQKMTINANGIATFTSPKVELDFSSGTTPNGDVVISKLNTMPHGNDFTNGIAETYWIINNYGTNKTFTGLSSIEFFNVGAISLANNAADFKLFKRMSNDDEIANWGTEIATGTSFDSSSQKVVFETSAIDSFSQFFITQDEVTLSTGAPVKKETTPIPFVVDKKLSFPDIKGTYKITVYDISGKELLKEKVGQNSVLLIQFELGVYLYWVETVDKMYSGKMIIE